MSTTHLRGRGPRATPQDRPVPDSSQVQNDAGGYAWRVTPWTRLERFLVLGTEGGTYYVDERELTDRAVGALRECAREDGPRAVRLVQDVSVAGRAPKNLQAVFALAVLAGSRDEATRRAAVDAIPAVCRTGTDLFRFAEFVEEQRGWGRALRRGVAAWYERESVEQLAYQAIKYRQREGWTHRDLLRLAHPHAPTAEHRVLYDWICGREVDLDGRAALDAIGGFERVQRATPATAAALVRANRLPWEALPDSMHNDPGVWRALLDAGVPQGALIRQLPRLTRLGLLEPLGDGNRLGQVEGLLRNPDRLRAARIHPLGVLTALATYMQGRSERGDSTWLPVARIGDALDAAFYDSFSTVEPTGARHLLAIDVSGSMRARITGAPLSCRAAAAAMAMATAASEREHHLVGFTGDGHDAWLSPNGTPYPTGMYSNTTPPGLVPLAISPRQRLDDACAVIDAARFGPTDCSIPMLYALDRGLAVDVFVVYTDGETWCGDVHPAQALARYRARTGIDAKLVVVAMTANGTSIADPDDPGMLDVVGFDATAPAVIADFARGPAREAC